MGGGWVNWNQPHIWAEITRYNLELFERPGWPKNHDAPLYALVNNKVIANPMSENMAQLFPLIEEFASVAREVFPRPFDPQSSMGQIRKYDHLSNADRLNQLSLSPLQRTLLTRLVAMQSHSDPAIGGYVEFLRWIALCNFDTETYFSTTSRYQFLNGTQALIDALLNDCEADIILNSPVQSIEQQPDGVTVSIKDGKTIHAKQAILATPINVLNTIEFSPPLNASKQALSQERHSGSGQKIYVRIAGHWPDLNCAGDATAPITTVIVQEAKETETFLILFTVNNKIEPVSKNSIEEALQLFVPEIKVLDYIYHDWVADPYALGTWCGYRPEQTSKYLLDAQFAGADIANGWRGFMDGAIESGLRVANEIKSPNI